MKKGRIYALCLALAVSCFVVMMARGEASGSRATLGPSLELREVDGVPVAFQSGEPYPSFERQWGRTYFDLGGTWKFKSLPSTDEEIEKSLRERNSAALSQLEREGYHLRSFDDSGWALRELPASENPLGCPVDENVYWYRRAIAGISEMRGKCVRLVLLGANYITDVWVNGRYVGWHEGGYTSFFFDVTDYLSYDNTDVIAIRVHNIPWDSRLSQMDTVPYRTLDFRNHGGIYRDIYLEAAEELHIVRADVVPSLKRSGDSISQSEAHIDVRVVLYNRGTISKTASLSLSVYGTRVDENNILNPAPEAIAALDLPVAVSGQTTRTASVPGGGVSVLTFSLDLSGVELWTPVNPTLYVLKASLNGGEDNLWTQFGVREVRVDENYPRLLLNGVPTFLAGIARHEVMPDVYNRFTAEQMENLMRDFINAKEANVNFIRTAHYPNHPYLYILADRMGFMIWEELAATWFSDEAFGVQLERGIARQMWLEMIYRDLNRPSIIIWSTANEADIYKEEPAPGISNRYRFNEELKKLAYQVDVTRLVTQATFWNRDPTWPVDDILGINEYQGVFYYSWAPVLGDYYEQTRDALRSTHEYQPKKPILASEMGTWSAGDNSRLLEQVRCWEDTFRALDEKPYVTGTTWWCLNDWWQAPGTDQTMGAISWDRTVKKEVYYHIKTSYENTWTRPWVKMLAPLDGDVVKDNVMIVALAEDYRGENVRVERVEYRIDSGDYVQMTYIPENRVWAALWNTAEGPDGEHSITVRAVDGDGQEKRHLITVVVNNLSRWVQSDWKGGAVPRRVSATENTIAFWRFDGLKRGRIWDDSKNANHGKVYHASLAPGRYGYGIYFENVGVDTDDAPHARIFYNDSLDFVSGDFTVEVWVKPAMDYPAADPHSATKGWRYFVRQDNRINGDWWDGCWWVGYDEWWDEVAFVVRNSRGGEQKAAYRMPLAADRWYHIAGVKGGGALKLYVDGVLRAVGVSPENTQPTGDLYINYHRANPSDPIYDTFCGVIDEVRIEGRALSDEEVAEHGIWSQIGAWEDSYDLYSLGENVDTSAPGMVTLSRVGNQPPSADFTFSPLAPTLRDNNNLVRFSDASFDPDGAVVSWLWDFGDGTTSTERNPSHMYASEGTYTVTLTVADDDGETDVVWDRITVSWEVLVFQDFEPGNGTQGDQFYDAWSSDPSFENVVTAGGSRALRMRAHGGDGGSHGGTVGVKPIPDAINMQNATVLSIWVYDNVGNNTVELRLVDADGTVGPSWWSSDHATRETTGRTRKGEWVEVIWDISDYPLVDMGRIVAIELYMWWDGVYLFDNISFSTTCGFTVSASRSFDSFPQPGTRTLSVTVDNIGPYGEYVGLSCSGMPSGVEVSFSPTGGPPGFTSTVTVTVAAATSPGIYALRIDGMGADGRLRSCSYTIAVGVKKFQDFEEGNGTPGAYFYDVYYTSPAFDTSLVLEGRRSLAFETSAGRGGAHGGTVGVNVASQSGYVNLQNATVLSLWVYDNVGNNTVELTLKDVHGNRANFGYSGKKSVKGRWTLIGWDISGFQPGFDMSRVVSAEFYEWWDGRYCFDDISFVEMEGFKVSLSFSSGSFSPGDSAEVLVFVERSGRYVENVELTCENVPEGLEVEFSRQSGMPDFASRMTVRAGENVKPGIYPLAVLGTGGDGRVRSCVYTVMVGEMVFQDFEPGNGTTGAYYSDVWQSSPSFDSQFVRTGTRSLKIVTGRGGGTVAIRAASQAGYIDLSEAGFLIVWVYDTQGSNTVQLRLRDVYGRGGSGGDGNYMWSSTSSVQNQWTKITWDLSQYPDVPGLDMTKIAWIELYEWNQGTYYFDDIKYVPEESRGSVFSEDLHHRRQSRGEIVVASPFVYQKHLEIPVFQRIHKEAYRSTGSLTSSVFDAGTEVCWGAVSWMASTPPSTSLKVYVRAGDGKDAVRGWTEWKEIHNGEDLPYRSRCIQYRIELRTEDSTVSPVFEGIRVSYSLTEAPMSWLILLLLAATIAIAAFLYKKRREILKKLKWGR